MKLNGKSIDGMPPPAGGLMLNLQFGPQSPLWQCGSNWRKGCNVMAMFNLNFLILGPSDFQLY